MARLENVKNVHTDNNLPVEFDPYLPAFNKMREYGELMASSLEDIITFAEYQAGQMISTYCGMMSDPKASEQLKVYLSNITVRSGLADSQPKKFISWQMQTVMLAHKRRISPYVEDIAAAMHLYIKDHSLFSSPSYEDAYAWLKQQVWPDRKGNVCIGLDACHDRWMHILRVAGLEASRPDPKKTEELQVAALASAKAVDELKRKRKEAQDTAEQTAREAMGLATKVKEENKPQQDEIDNKGENEDLAEEETDPEDALEAIKVLLRNNLTPTQFKPLGSDGFLWEDGDTVYRIGDFLGGKIYKCLGEALKN